MARCGAGRRGPGGQQPPPAHGANVLLVLCILSAVLLPQTLASDTHKALQPTAHDQHAGSHPVDPDIGGKPPDKDSAGDSRVGGKLGGCFPNTDKPDEPGVVNLGATKAVCAVPGVGVQDVAAWRDGVLRTVAARRVGPRPRYPFLPWRPASPDDDTHHVISPSAVSCEVCQRITSLLPYLAAFLPSNEHEVCVDEGWVERVCGAVKEGLRRERAKLEQLSQQDPLTIPPSLLHATHLFAPLSAHPHHLATLDLDLAHECRAQATALLSHKAHALRQLTALSHRLPVSLPVASLGCAYLGCCGGEGVNVSGEKAGRGMVWFSSAQVRPVDVDREWLESEGACALGKHKLKVVVDVAVEELGRVKTWQFRLHDSPPNDLFSSLEYTTRKFLTQGFQNEQGQGDGARVTSSADVLAKCSRYHGISSDEESDEMMLDLHSLFGGGQSLLPPHLNWQFTPADKHSVASDVQIAEVFAKLLLFPMTVKARDAFRKHIAHTVHAYAQHNPLLQLPKAEALLLHDFPETWCGEFSSQAASQARTHLYGDPQPAEANDDENAQKANGPVFPPSMLNIKLFSVGPSVTLSAWHHALLPLSTEASQEITKFLVAKGKRHSSQPIVEHVPIDVEVQITQDRSASGYQALAAPAMITTNVYVGEAFGGSTISCVVLALFLRANPGAEKVSVPEACLH